MSTALELTDDTLAVHVEGADRFWALKGRFEIPLAHVTGARAATDEARKWMHGLRLGGTHIPGVISAGRFYSKGRLVFWNVHDPDKAIAIELRDERYSHLVLEVADPDADIRRLQEAAAALPVG